MIYQNIGESPCIEGLDVIFRSHYPTVTGGARVDRPAARGTLLLLMQFHFRLTGIKTTSLAFVSRVANARSPLLGENFLN